MPSFFQKMEGEIIKQISERVKPKLKGNVTSCGGSKWQVDNFQGEIRVADSSWLIADREEFFGWQVGRLLSLY
jgi:hypothetical protein